MIGKNEDRDRIAAALAAPLDPERVSRRRGPGGTSLDYVAWHERCRAMNEAAGLLWSSEITRHEVEVVERERVDRRTGEAVPAWDATASAVVRVLVGPYGAPWAVREGIGYGSAEGQPSKGAALELAGKAAASDALSRALCLFGERTGLALYVTSERERDERGLVAPPPAPFTQPHPPVDQHQITRPEEPRDVRATPTATPPAAEPPVSSLPGPAAVGDVAAEDAAERAAIQAQAEEPAPKVKPQGQTYGSAPEVDPAVLAALDDRDRAQLLAAAAAGPTAVARLGRELWGKVKDVEGSQKKTAKAFADYGWSGTGSPGLETLGRVMVALAGSDNNKDEE